MVKIKKSEFKKLYDVACESWKAKFDEKFKSQMFSNNLEIEESFISEMRKACTKDQLPIFNKIFKDNKVDVLSVKTYSEVCKHLKEKEYTLEDFKMFDSKDATRLLAKLKIQQLEKFFNQGWTPNWKNQSEYKYYPYFSINSSGGLVFLSYGYFDSGFAGRAGFFKSSEIATHVGKNFIDIYNDLM
jgi:hypothetical protein